MHDAIRGMIEKRRPQGPLDWDRALREVLQEAALAGLWRTGFFDRAAFYGGTALRLFHGLDRFSEDLDFTLLAADPEWKLSERLEGLRAEIEAFGFSVDIEAKHEGKIDSTFIKANTKIQLIRIEAPQDVTGSAAPNRLVKVKLETDTDPPGGIRTEMKTLLEPFPVSVRVVTPPCLFAGEAPRLPLPLLEDPGQGKGLVRLPLLFSPGRASRCRPSRGAAPAERALDR